MAINHNQTAITTIKHNSVTITVVNHGQMQFLPTPRVITFIGTYCDWSLSSETAYDGDTIGISGNTVTCTDAINHTVRWQVTVSQKASTTSYTYGEPSISTTSFVVNNDANVRASATRSTRYYKVYCVIDTTDTGGVNEWFTSTNSTATSGNTGDSSKYTYNSTVYAFVKLKTGYSKPANKDWVRVSSGPNEYAANAIWCIGSTKVTTDNMIIGGTPTQATNYNKVTFSCDVSYITYDSLSYMLAEAGYTFSGSGVTDTTALTYTYSYTPGAAISITESTSSSSVNMNGPTSASWRWKVENSGTFFYFDNLYLSGYDANGNRVSGVTNISSAVGPITVSIDMNENLYIKFIAANGAGSFAASGNAGRWHSGFNKLYFGSAGTVAGVSSSGTVTMSGCVVSAIPNSGYRFSSFTNIVNNEPVYSNKIVTANFV